MRGALCAGENGEHCCLGPPVDPVSSGTAEGDWEH